MFRIAFRAPTLSGAAGLAMGRTTGSRSALPVPVGGSIGALPARQDPSSASPGGTDAVSWPGQIELFAPPLLTAATAVVPGGQGTLHALMRATPGEPQARRNLLTIASSKRAEGAVEPSYQSMLVDPAVAASPVQPVQAAVHTDKAEFRATVLATKSRLEVSDLRDIAILFEKKD